MEVLSIMSKTKMILMFAGCLVLLSGVFPPQSSADDYEVFEQRRADLIAKFDKDGDGRLNAAERESTFPCCLGRDKSFTARTYRLTVN